MARKLNMVVRPSSALAHLSAMVEDGASRWPAGLSERLRRELCAELTRQHDELSLYARCVAWLERRRLVRVERPRGPRGGESTPLWLCPLTFKIDLDALCQQAAQPSVSERPRDSAQERAWVSCHALRRVLRFIAQRGLIEATSLRAGKLRASAVDALAGFEALCAESGLSWGRGLPPVLGEERTERVERAESKVEPKAEPRARASEKMEKTARSEPAKAEAPKVETRKTEAPKSEAPKTEKREKSAGSAGFGGLPDDAEPEDRRATEPLSARGLTTDAEFFLSETSIAEWPCDLATLSRARRSAVSRLHPDRAGDASAPLFHRVLKGHAELLLKLSQLPAPPTADKPVATSPVTAPVPSPAAAPPAPVAQPAPVVPPAPKSSVCEWPPPPKAPAVARVAPAVAPTPMPARAPQTPVAAAPSVAPNEPSPTPRRAASKARREARVVSL